MPPASNSSLSVFIRRLEAINAVDEELREAIEMLAPTVRELPARQDIVRDRDRPTQCVVILRGWAFRYKLLSEGKRQILSFHIAGDTPDLQSLHLRVMDHSLSTLTRATVGFVSHDSLNALVARFPAVATTLWRETLVDAATFREWMTGLGRRTAFGQVAHLFCELYTKQAAVGLADNYACPLPIPQSDLGDALGLSNVHVNRVLREMRGLELVSLRSGTLQILDWRQLAAAAEFDPTYLHLVK